MLAAGGILPQPAREASKYSMAGSLQMRATTAAHDYGSFCCSCSIATEKVRHFDSLNCLISLWRDAPGAIMQLKKKLGFGVLCELEQADRCWLQHCQAAEWHMHVQVLFSALALRV